MGSRRRARAHSRRGVLCAAGEPQVPGDIVEPDVFHDLFGHVPLLFDSMFSDYMQAYGAGGLKASRLQACEYLARLYWYTVEFG
jgi:phenylalanine-4-hydroxylase